jgi:hypothetical protein
VGVKLTWLINDQGEVVDWTWNTANELGNVFRPLASGYEGETITLADLGLRQKDAPLQNVVNAAAGMSGSPSKRN